MVLNIVIWGVLLFPFLAKINQPLSEIKKKQLYSLENSLIQLSEALAIFGSGNLTANSGGQIFIQAKDPGRDLSEVFKKNQKIISVLNRGISEFNSITAEPSKRICFIGSNAFQEGLLAGIETGEFMNNSGKITIYIPDSSQTTHELRLKGFINSIHTHYPGIKISAIEETDGKLEIITKKLSRNIQEYPDFKCIYITDGFTPSAAGKVIRESGKKIFIITHDVVASNMSLLKDGIIQILIGQKAFAQAYNSIIGLYNSYEHN